jgi:hypothetical protein
MHKSFLFIYVEDVAREVLVYRRLCLRLGLLLRLEFRDLDQIERVIETKFG